MVMGMPVIAFFSDADPNRDRRLQQLAGEGLGFQGRWNKRR
jgi:hypothetical protein